LISRAAKGGAKALFLPEASDYISLNASESLSLVESADTGVFMTGIKNAAKQHTIAVNVGIHEPTDDKKRVKNTLVWVDENGDLTKRYQKIHLFDVDLENGPKLRESAYVFHSISTSLIFMTAPLNLAMKSYLHLRLLSEE
jgi:predicted amidohydrolase